MRKVVAIFIGLSLLLLPGQAQIILLSRDAEISIGREVAKEIEKEYGVLDDPKLTERIERIGKSLVKVCDRPNMPYSFKVLKEDKELNAFAAPGGFIYITDALVKVLESDDEIAFVLGHEIGHISGDHIRKRLSQMLLGSTLLDILTGRSSQSVQLGSQVAFLLYERGYSRNHERDADTRAITYMQRAGYNPIAALTALKKLGDQRHRGLVKWFATHPSPPERVERLAKRLNVDPVTFQPL
ncbi:MAG: M48 family metallopeptidase, partial [Armatimonadetes bacterium]|nr:M48 family metallopeptidase [Armatimonadota bacterium]MDW8121714.1 M48 family metallopeptidase [Armatimonadota bacterium]